jgi:dipeptidyl aminopeptidase/acylaminoacyl peptidase
MAPLFSLLVALAATGALAVTPEQMISAPRRSDAVPNPSGDIAFFHTQSYSFEDEEWDEGWQLLDLKTGNITDLGLNASEVSEIAWLPSTETGIIYINGTNEDTPGGVSIWISDALNPSESTLAASLPAPFSGLKVAKTSSGDISFVVNSLAYPNGTAYNEELAVTPSHTGRLYSNIYPRHWDQWLTKNRQAVFAGTLKSNASSTPTLRNLLQDLNFTVTRPESPVQPFGDLGDYDISPDGKTVAFLTKAPELPKANTTASYIYLVPVDGSAEPVAINGPVTDAQEAGIRGASGIPRFSPDGTKLAFAQMEEVDYESDRNQLYVVDVSGATASNWRGLANEWDRSVGSIVWARDGESIYVHAEDAGITKLFNIPLDAADNFVPKNLTGVDNVIAFATLPNNSFIVSSNSVWSSRDFYTLTNGTKNLLFSSTTADPELAGLGPHTYSEFYYDGADEGVRLQAHIIRPSNFTAGKKYPLAYIIHGGPQTMNTNAWSTRWNFQVWADQGYVVVAPNPTGSSGFGKLLTDRIQNNWGGTPYDDIVLGWEYIRDHLSDFIDVENGIEAGASYGGFMTNWIQGHDFGRNFKALVTHDGVSNTLADYASEELWFIQRDMNGTIWDDRANYERWNPLDHISNFSTPHFVVHNTLDYRLPESDGLALFNILQEIGVPSRFLNFPDENHWVLKPKNSLFWHQSIFNWINHYSGVGGSLNDEAVGE